MRRAMATATLALVASLSTGCPKQRADPAYSHLPTYRVVGRVVNFDTNEGISRADVILHGPGGRVWTVKKTNFDGYFTLHVPRIDGFDFLVQVLADDFDLGQARVPRNGNTLFTLRLYTENSTWRRATAPVWREGRTPTLYVAGTAEEADIRELVSSIESFRTLLRQASGEQADIAEPVVPLTLYALRDENDLRELMPDIFEGRTAGLGGVARGTEYAMELFVVLGKRDSAGQLSDPGHTIRHEYHHAFYDRSAPWAPLWLREGMAEMWASASVLDGRAPIGLLDPHDARYLARHRLMPLADLLAVNTRSKNYRDSMRASVFYIQSAFLTHYLLYEVPGGAAKMEEYGKRLEGGVRDPRAFEETWGDLVTMQTALSRYVAAGKFRHVLHPAPRVAAEPITLSTVTDGRLHAIKGLALARGKDPSLAKEHLDKARVADPADPFAIEGGLLFLLDATGDRDANASAFEAAASTSGAGLAAVHLAITSAPRTPRGALVSPKSFERNVSRLRTLAPRHPHGIALEGALLAARDTTRARALALEAIRLAPGDPDYFIRAARIFRVTGEPTEAGQLTARAVAAGLESRSSAQVAALCFIGVRMGFANEMSAVCERAVTLDPESWRARDARAFLRYARGDREGALEDLRFVLGVDEPESAAFRARRQSYVETLEASPKSPLPLDEDPWF